MKCISFVGRSFICKDLTKGFGKEWSPTEDEDDVADNVEEEEVEEEEEDEENDTTGETEEPSSQSLEDLAEKSTEDHPVGVKNKALCVCVCVFDYSD